MVNLAALADKIADLCLLKGISVSKMLASCGLDKNTMHNLRSGMMPSIEKIALIADFFEIPISALLGDERSNNPSMSAGRFGLIADKILEEKGLKSLSREEEEKLIKSFEIHLENFRLLTDKDAESE
jgi:transcriptional regulator with XRE-family HTH domain